jgi:hypothetical protein
LFEPNYIIIILDMYNVDIQQIGLLGGLPMICSVVVIPINAYIADYLRMDVLDVPKVRHIVLYARAVHF